MIPVYKIRIPEYSIKELESLSGEMIYTVFGTAVPIEYWSCKPDFIASSLPIVEFLRNNHMHQKIGLRFLSSMAHPKKTVDELIEIIRQLGHDRYDPKRKGNQYNNLENKSIEIFALTIQVGKNFGEDGEEQIKHALQSFYMYPFSQGRRPLKIDLGIVYDMNALEPIPHHYIGREDEVKKDGFRFKDKDKRTEAVIEILKII